MNTPDVIEQPKAPTPVACSDLLCCVGASLPSEKFGAWIVDEIRGSRVRLISGNLKFDQWRDKEDVESMLQVVKQHNESSSATSGGRSATNATKL